MTSGNNTPVTPCMSVVRYARKWPKVGPKYWTQWLESMWRKIRKLYSWLKGSSDIETYREYEKLSKELMKGTRR